MARSNRAAGKSGGKLIPILIALAVLLGGGWAVKAFFLDAAAPKTILLMGVDEGKTRTDVVMVAHIDPKQNLVNLVSLPRDTLVEIPCEGIKYCVTPDKLAHAHVYGGEDGAVLTVKAVESLLDIKIDHHVSVDYAGFEKVIDLLGGVDIVIDKNMDYEDPYAHPPLSIHFKAKKEPQHLSGEQALKYVRFRADGLGDIGRIERTKKFAHALAKTAKENGTVSKLPSLVSAIWPYVKTDLDTTTAVSLARMAPKIDLNQIQMEMIPGADETLKDGRWVWKADKAKTEEITARLIKNPKPVQ